MLRYHQTRFSSFVNRLTRARYTKPFLTLDEPLSSPQEIRSFEITEIRKIIRLIDAVFLSKKYILCLASVSDDSEYDHVLGEMCSYYSYYGTFLVVLIRPGSD